MNPLSNFPIIRNRAYYLIDIPGSGLNEKMKFIDLKTTCQQFTQFIKSEEENTKSHAVHVSGFSLGGAMALQVTRNLQENSSLTNLRCTADSTFTSTTAIAKSYVTNKNVLSFIKRSGFNLDSKENLRKLNENGVPTTVPYSSKDPLFKGNRDAQLGPGINHNNVHVIKNEKDDHSPSDPNIG